MRCALWCWQCGRDLWATPRARPSTAWLTTQVGSGALGCPKAYPGQPAQAHTHTWPCRCCHGAAVLHVRHPALLPAPHAARRIGRGTAAPRAGLPHAARHTHGGTPLCTLVRQGHQRNHLQAGGRATAVLHRSGQGRDVGGGGALRICALSSCHVLPALPGPCRSGSLCPAQGPCVPAEKGEGAAELLAARGFALLLMLSECEEPSFMDQVAQHQATRRLADHVNNRAAAYIGQVRRAGKWLAGGRGPVGWCVEQWWGAIWP